MPNFMSGLHIHMLLNSLNFLAPHNLLLLAVVQFLQTKQAMENTRFIYSIRRQVLVFVQLLYSVWTVYI
jgi:hypothetical protein